VQTLRRIETMTLSASDERARRAVEENLWRMWAQFGRGAGCTLHETQAALWFETPIPVPPYNMVVRFQGGADCDGEVDAIFAQFRKRGVPFLWFVHPSASPGDLAERLKRRGFDEVEAITGMAANMHALPPLPPAPAGVEVHEVTPAHDLTAFVEFVAARWQVPASARAHLQSIVDIVRIGAEGSPNRAWIAVKDGVAIAKAFTHDGAGEVGLYGMATKPEARGLGLGRLLCLTALHSARERGHDLAVLQSSPMAVSLYRGVGFRELAPFRLFAVPNSFYA
jgi:ribosomal protein S18 acetylase RimI-like enzyme